MSSGDSLYDDEPPEGSLDKLRALLVEHSELRARISRARKYIFKYEVPYLAGSSLSGEHVYFDPALIKGTINSPYARTLVALHEIVEWSLKPWHREYEFRHHLATAAEDDYCARLGHSPAKYRALLRPLYKPIEHEAILSCPPDLDLSPYSGKLKGYLYDLQHGKLPKARVGYGPGVMSRKCALCSMFRAPHDCSLVAGDVQASDVCDRFVRRREEG